MALPAGLSPAAWRFEAARSDILSYGSVTTGYQAIGFTSVLEGIVQL